MSANGTTPAERETFVQDELSQGARLVPEGIEILAGMFCGCGEPEKAWEWVLAYLSSLESDRKCRLKTGADYVAAYALDHCRLTEHGSSICFPWLTDTGKEALAFLREHGPGWAEAGIWWINSEGTTLSNLESV